MKKTIITAIILILAINVALAQCWKNINNNTTHWNQHDIVNGVEQNRNYNGFDWTAQTYDKFYLQFLPPGYSNPVTLTLPMWHEPGSTGSTCINTKHFADILDFDEKDFHPEDGWELLNKNFGSAGAGNEVSNPFFALYNKYTGKIRVFFLTPDKLNTLSSLLVTLDFYRAYSQKITGMMQNIRPISQVLLNLLPDLHFNTPNYGEAGEYFYWYTADYVVTYDPCTCNNIDNAKSELKFSLLKITDAEITLNINGLTQQVVKNGVKQQTDNSYSFDELLDPGVLKSTFNAGQKGYKSWYGNMTNFTKWIDGMKDVQKTEVNDALSKFNSDKLPVTPIPRSIQDIVSEISGNTKTYKQFLGMEFSPSSVKNIKNIASVVPYVGAAISLYELFSGGGAKTDNNENNAAPIVYTQNLSAKGYITQKTPYTSFIFRTPGSVTSGTPYIPHYNNILGVFNVLDIPDLEYIQYQPGVTPNWFSCRNENFSILENNVKEYDKILNQYRLSSDLKYVLNPASNLEIFSIDAAYVLEYRENYSDFGQNASYLPITDFRNLEGECVSYPVTGDIYDHNFKDLKYLSNTGYFIENIYKDSLVVLRTKYVPLNSLKHHSFILEDYNTNDMKPKIYIKLMIKLKRLDDPNAELVTLIHSYDFTNALTNANNLNVSGLSYEKRFLYEKEIHPDNTYTVKGQEVVGKLESIWPSLDYSVDEINVPANSTISTDLYAKKKITIGSNVTINSGVTLRAGNEIKIDPTNVFYPNVNFIVGLRAFPGWEDNPELLHNTDNEITTHCNSQRYKDLVILTKKDKPIIPPKKYSKIIIELYPNPATDRVKLQMYLPSSFEHGSIKIYDITGKLYFDNSISVKKPGSSNLEIDVSSLASGVYFLKFDTEIGSNISKFIIVK